MVKRIEWKLKTEGYAQIVDVEQITELAIEDIEESCDNKAVELMENDESLRLFWLTEYRYDESDNLVEQSMGGFYDRAEWIDRENEPRILK